MLAIIEATEHDVYRMPCTRSGRIRIARREAPSEQLGPERGVIAEGGGDAGNEQREQTIAALGLRAVTSECRILVLTTALYGNPQSRRPCNDNQTMNSRNSCQRCSRTS